MLQEGGPLSGPDGGLLSNTWKWTVWGNTWADKAKNFTGEGHLGREQEGKGIREDSLATWLEDLGFMEMEWVFRLSLANHSDSGSLLVVHTLLSQDGRQQEGFWEVVGHVVSPFNFSRTLLGRFSSVQFSRSVMSDSLRPHELQHARPPFPSPTPGVYPNPCPSSRWCHAAISSSSPSPPALNPSQDQGLFQWVNSLHEVAKGLELRFSISPSVGPPNCLMYFD